jgi:uncharacterized protein (TIGR03067 family)
MTRRTWTLLVTGLMTIAAPRAAADPGDADEQAREKLQGSWQVVSIELVGSPYKQAGGLWVIRGDKITGVGTFRLVPGTNPKALDLLTVTNQRWLGIYSLEGDELKMCFACSGKLADREGCNRPQDFEPRKMHLVITARRTNVQPLASFGP